MTSITYELIGRIVVRFVRVRYRRELRIAATAGGVAVLAAAAVAYALGASREVEEG